MTTKLIIYHLEDTDKDFSSIRDAIKKFPKWAKIMDRTWLIKTNKSAGYVRSFLSESIGNRGKIFVINLETKTWGSYGVDKKTTEWLKENLDI